ncbi:hypothetical protein Hanom_Chr05g00393881 [Helianthus anomalus]
MVYVILCFFTFSLYLLEIAGMLHFVCYSDSPLSECGLGGG